MTIEEAKKELEKFVKLKTTQRPLFLDVILDALNTNTVSLEAGDTITCADAPMTYTCNRSVCMKNEYNGIDCDECEVRNG